MVLVASPVVKTRSPISLLERCFHCNFLLNSPICSSFFIWAAAEIHFRGCNMIWIALKGHCQGVWHPSSPFPLQDTMCFVLMSFPGLFRTDVKGLGTTLCQALHSLFLAASVWHKTMTLCYCRPVDMAPKTRTMAAFPARQRSFPEEATRYADGTKTVRDSFEPQSWHQAIRRTMQSVDLVSQGKDSTTEQSTTTMNKLHEDVLDSLYGLCWHWKSVPMST